MCATAVLTIRHTTADRPPAAFISRNSPCLHVYIFVTSPVLAHVANAPHLAGYCRPLPRRFVSPSSAASTAPPGPAFLLPRAVHLFHLDVDEPRRLAYTAPSNGPGHR